MDMKGACLSWNNHVLANPDPKLLRRQLMAGKVCPWLLIQSLTTFVVANGNKSSTHPRPNYAHGDQCSSGRTLRATSMALLYRKRADGTRRPKASAVSTHLDDSPVAEEILKAYGQWASAMTRLVRGWRIRKSGCETKRSKTRSKQKR